MTLALAVAGLGAAMIVWCRARARLERIARAEHEVRGALHAVGLAIDARTLAPAAVSTQLARAGVALSDLTAARTGCTVKVEGKTVQVPVATLFAELEAVWAPAFAARGRRLTVVPAAGAVSGDAVRLTGAASNLLANALEHGRGETRLRAHRTAGGVRLEVADAGHGPRRRRPPLTGHGIRGRGLAIAAGVARDHGGRLVLEHRAAALELPVRAAQRRHPGRGNHAAHEQGSVAARRFRRRGARA